ncbi:hypothetical protein PI125_g12923 [Phytophthora idaei]|nr:hypothetical protein PI125_g12923 [Phytophthora idaei]
MRSKDFRVMLDHRAAVDRLDITNQIYAGEFGFSTSPTSSASTKRVGQRERFGPVSSSTYNAEDPYARQDFPGIYAVVVIGTTFRQHR